MNKSIRWSVIAGQVLSAAELFAAAPLGATIAYSDGKPKPPARHKIKVRDWESRNGIGLFLGVAPKLRPKEWDQDSFTMQEGRYGGDGLRPTIIVNCTTSVPRATERGMTYTVQSVPEPGGILLLSDHGTAIHPIERSQVEAFGRVELRHYWRDYRAAIAWCEANRYTLPDQLSRLSVYLMVGGDGTAREWIPPGTVGNVAIQCEADTGETGSFLYKPVPNKALPIRELVRLSPVFQSLAQLYPFLRSEGWKPVHEGDEYVKGSPSDFDLVTGVLEGAGILSRA